MSEISYVRCDYCRKETTKDKARNVENSKWIVITNNAGYGTLKLKSMLVDSRGRSDVISILNAEEHYCEFSCLLKRLREEHKKFIDMKEESYNGNEHSSKS